MTTILEHPAKQITVNSEETLEQFARRIEEMNSDIAFGDGTPIDLDSRYIYSFLLFELSRRLTTEEFGKFAGAVMHTITQMEKSGELEEGLIREVGTAFDVTPPSIPERFIKSAPKGVTYFPRLAGTIGYTIETCCPPDPPQVD